MTTLHYGPSEEQIEWSKERYVLDVAYEHVQRTRPDVPIKDLVMHPELAESSAGGCARVRQWCAERGIRAVLTTWAPRHDFYFGNLDLPPRSDPLHVPWITPFTADRFRQ